MAEVKVKKPRGPGKRFVKGQSGNPAGKPTRHSQLQQYLSKAMKIVGVSDEELIAGAIRLAQGGDSPTIRLLLELRYNKTKPVMPGYKVEVDRAADVGVKAEAISTSMLDGEIPADIAQAMLSVLESTARLSEFSELVREADNSGSLDDRIRLLFSNGERR